MGNRLMVLKVQADDVPDIAVSVSPADNGQGYVVDWSDGDGVELPTLSSALMFVAALARCGESDWNRWIAFDGAEFADAADQFLGSATTS